MNWKYLPLLIGVLLAVSCKKKGCTDPAAENYDASAEKDDNSCTYAPTYASSFNFNHTIDGSSFQFDTIQYAHPGGYDYSVQTLKYFISDIVLHKTNGDSIWIDMEHYIDAATSSTQSYQFNQSIENTSYSGVSFVFGLNVAKNITGAYNNPPESLMEWPVPMGGGYHYMKFEGKYDSLGVTKNYNVHTGAAMGNPYHFIVNLPTPFTVTNNEVNIDFSMELNNWFQNPTLFDFNVYGEAIMGDMTAQQTVQANGIDVFSN